MATPVKYRSRVIVTLTESEQPDKIDRRNDEKVSLGESAEAQNCRKAVPDSRSEFLGHHKQVYREASHPQQQVGVSSGKGNLRTLTIFRDGFKTASARIHEPGIEGFRRCVVKSSRTENETA